MQWTNTRERYGLVIRLLHWLVAIAIVVQIVIAFYAHDLPRGLEKFQWMNTHKSLGFTILCVMIFRMLWIVFNTSTAMPSHMVPWQTRLASITHWSLYALVIAMGFSGWLMASAGNLPIKFWGVFLVPDLIEPHKDWVDTIEEVHETLAWLLMIVVGVHLAAVIYHMVVLKDKLLRRMWND